MNRCIDHFDSGDELYIRSIFEEALMICMFCSFIKCKRLVVRKMSIKRRKDIMSSITYIKRKERWITFLNTLSNKNTAVQLNLPRYVLSIVFSDMYEYSVKYSHFWNNDYAKLSQKMPKINDNVQVEDIIECTSKTYSYHTEPIANGDFDISQLNFQPSDNNPTLKTIQIRIYPTKYQADALLRHYNVYQYVKEKPIEQMYKEEADFKTTVNEDKKKIYVPSEFSLRNMLVTDKTKTTHKKYMDQADVIEKISKAMEKVKKESHEYEELKLKKIEEQFKLKTIAKELPFEKNENVTQWETATPKATRQIAVKTAVSNYKSGQTNLKLGHISSFNMKKTEEKEMKRKNKTVGVDKSMVTIKNGIITVSKALFPSEYETTTKELKNGNITVVKTEVHNHQVLNMSKRNTKKFANLNIEHDVTIKYFKGKQISMENN